MTASAADRSVQHDRFTIERRIAATPAAVFAAWSTIEGESRWFAGTAGEWTLDMSPHPLPRSTGRNPSRLSIRPIVILSAAKDLSAAR